MPRYASIEPERRWQKLSTRAPLEWLKQSEYDLDTAGAMHAAGRYMYVVYMSHLAVEKALKAAIVALTQDIPPRIHNLIRLAQVDLEPGQREFIATLNSAAVGARYPEFLEDAVRTYPGHVARDYLEKARELVQWLSAQTLKRQ